MSICERVGLFVLRQRLLNESDGRAFFSPIGVRLKCRALASLQQKEVSSLKKTNSTG